ncbi:MAG: diacylglycerol kinase family protein [Gemmatimonadales bacterium]
MKRRYLPSNRFWSDVLPTKCVRLTDTIEELDAAVAHFRRTRVAAVAALGGDGTVHRLVDALVRHYGEADLPMVAILAGGTMNGLPRALGSGAAPERVLRAALAAFDLGDPPIRRQHLLRVSDACNGTVRHGFSFATGVVYRAFEQYYRTFEPGMIDAVRASLWPLTTALSGRSLADIARLDVRVDHQHWMPELPHTLVASVIENPVLWFKPFGDALGDNAAFHLVATSMHAAEIAPRLWPLFRGRCRHPRLRVGHCQDVTIHGNTGYLIDGDCYAPADAVDVRVTLGPQLRLLVPTAVP